ncbi:MAG: formylglycine-generating enzyme family protein [Chloroflexi bacterium]|nr:formylglycine-generating enzyme family protein [Chloroflexota bacterium]
MTDLPSSTMVTEEVTEQGLRVRTYRFPPRPDGSPPSERDIGVWRAGDDGPPTPPGFITARMQVPQPTAVSPTGLPAPRRRRHPFRWLRLGMTVFITLSIACVLALLTVQAIGPGRLIALVPLNSDDPLASSATTEPIAIGELSPADTILPSPTLDPASLLPSPIPTTAAPTQTIDFERTTNGLRLNGVEMLLVSGGSFEMGSSASLEESPPHQVSLAPYFIDRTEVTNSQWESCVSAGACTLPAQLTSFDGQPYYGRLEFADRPVIYVTWPQADAYCTWRAARLPTEADWEMAARWNPFDQSVSLYPWGNDWDPTRLNGCDASCALEDLTLMDRSLSDGYPQTAPVGRFPDGASPIGALDMAGNVAEWVADWFDAEYYGTSPPNNPAGPTSGRLRVVRGGGWNFAQNWATTTARSRFHPNTASAGIGLRCAISEQDLSLP